MNSISSTFHVNSENMKLICIIMHLFTLNQWQWCHNFCGVILKSYVILCHGFSLIDLCTSKYSIWIPGSDSQFSQCDALNQYNKEKILQTIWSIHSTIIPKLDQSMARRHLKSLSVASSHLTLQSHGHIWGLEFNRYVCFSFRGNQTIFSWDIANSIFHLENSRSRSWPRSNPMVPFEA